jgi:hypothetical protein
LKKTSAPLVAEVPSGLVTVTSTAPVPYGAMTDIEVSESDSMVARTPPKLTLKDPGLSSWGSTKLVPVIVTTVPPAEGPESGLTEVTAGTGPLAPTLVEAMRARGTPEIAVTTATEQHLRIDILTGLDPPRHSGDGRWSTR